MSEKSINQHVFHRMQRTLPERGIYIQFFRADTDNGVLQLGHLPVEPAGENWDFKMAELIGVYISAEKRGLNSQRLDVAIICPHCGEEVVARFSVLADWAQQHLDGQLTLDEVVDNVIATQESAEH